VQNADFPITAIVDALKLQEDESENNDAYTLGKIIDIFPYSGR
jgi:hypothetical protein